MNAASGLFTTENELELTCIFYESKHVLFSVFLLSVVEFIPSAKP